MSMVESTWEVRTLKDWGMQAQTGFASGAHNQTNVGIPHLRPMNVSRTGLIDLGEVKYVSATAGRHRLEPGDILFNNTNSDILVGKTAVFSHEGDFAFSNHMTRLRFPKDNVDSKYMASRLHALWIDGFFKAICNNHVSQASVSTKALEALEIALPPLDVQQRIVETLDDHLSRLDKALAEVKAASLQTSALRRSLLEDALFGESPLPWTTLGEHVQTRKNKGIPSQEPLAKYLGLEHVESHGGRVLGFDSASKYRSASPIVEQGDLLYGRLRPYLNKVVLAPERLYVSGEFIVMMPTATLDSKFLKHLLMSPRFLAFTALLDTGDRPRVSWDKIANFEFQIPDLARQKQIVDQIESSLNVAGSLHADFEQLEGQIAILRRALLHSAFAGNMTNG